MSKLAFRADLAAHVLSETEVAVLGEDSRYVLRGKAYARIVPLINGTRRAGEVVAAADRVAPPVAWNAIERLKALGILEQRSGVDPAAPAAPLTVRAAGIDGTLVEQMRSRLTVAALRPVTVFLVDDYFRPELAAAARDLPAGERLLPVRPVGREAWFGPLLGDADRPADWDALVARLRMTRNADAAALDAGASLPLWPPRVEARSVDLALAFAARLAEKIGAGIVPDAVAGAITTLDTDTLGLERHAVPLPASPVARPVRVTLAEGVKRFRTDGGHRTMTPHETLERLTPFVSTVTGIVGTVERLNSPSTMPVYAAVQRQDASLKPSRTENRLIGSPGGAVGKGETEIQAKVSCIAEAVERFSCGDRPDPQRRRATMAEIGEDAIHPNAIQNFSDIQFARVNDPPEHYGTGFNRLVERFDPEVAVDWTPVWSLTHERVRWVPSALCHFGHRIAEGPQFAMADSNGCASGNTLEEAILQGLLELVERDACALWWYNRLPRPGIDTASLADDPVARLAGAYAALGRTIAVMDLTNDLGIPSAAAISWREGGTAILVSIGTHLDPRIAISRAVCELNQAVAMEAAAPSKAFDAPYARWLETATTASDPHVVPLPGCRIRAADMPDLSAPTLRADIELIVARLAEAGIETLVLDLTHPDIGFPVARVFAPGLRHFWGRLGPGRLYEVPVKLGWLDRPLREDEMNPFPFPL